MNNSPLQVFKGGWEELENAIHTTNKTNLISFRSFTLSPDESELYVLTSTNVETYPLNTPGILDSRGSLTRTFPHLITNPKGIKFKTDDGKKIYIGDVLIYLWVLTLTVLLTLL